MRVLNLYAGLGGNRKLWEDVDVTAVEKSWEIAEQYKKFYPNDRLIMADAHQFLINNHKEYDFVWSSPPCQTHSMMVKGSRHKVKKYPDMTLYQEILFLQHFYKGLWVVENVKPYYKPLIDPTAIIGRHYYWANFNITEFLEDVHFENFINTGTVADSQHLKKWLGLEYSGNIYYGDNHDPNQVLRNCVHPKIGLHIFNCALSKDIRR